jgi:hypothetical protein
MSRYGRVQGADRVSFSNPNTPLFVDQNGAAYNLAGVQVNSTARVTVGGWVFTAVQAPGQDAPVPGITRPVPSTNPAAGLPHVPIPGRKPLPPTVVAGDVHTINRSAFDPAPIPGRKPAIPAMGGEGGGGVVLASAEGGNGWWWLLPVIAIGAAAVM